MNRCKRCGVRVMDDTQICPLCHGVLTQETTAEEHITENAVGYPDVKQKTRRFQKAGRILLFLSLALEVVLVFVNYLTYDAFSKPWSMITGGVIAYLILTLWDLLGHRQGHIREIYTQIFVVLGLLILIDFSLDWTGWSL